MCFAPGLWPQHDRNWMGAGSHRGPRPERRSLFIHRRDHPTETCLRGRIRQWFPTDLGSTITCRDPRPNPTPTRRGHEVVTPAARSLRPRDKLKLHGDYM